MEKFGVVDNFLDMVCYNLPARLEEDWIVWKPVKAGKFEVSSYYEVWRSLLLWSFKGHCRG